VVHCKQVGNGNSALKYLSPYNYRVAITNNRIEKLENDQVRFRFKDSDTDQLELAIVPALKFICRFLQHVLPKNFVKIRYYGFLSPNRRNFLACILPNGSIPLPGHCSLNLAPGMLRHL